MHPDLDFARGGKEAGKRIDALNLPRRHPEAPRLLIPLRCDVEHGIPRLVEPLVKKPVKGRAGRFLDRHLEIVCLDVPERKLVRVMADRAPERLLAENETEHVQDNRSEENT